MEVGTMSTLLVHKLFLYEKYRDQMKTGDALQYRSREILGRLIRIFSPGFNHTGLVMRLDEYCGEERRVWTMESMSRGVKLGKLSEKLMSYDGEVWWCPLKPEYESKRTLIGHRALELVDTPYDFQGLFKNIISSVSLDAKELFCSAYAYMCWKEAGIVTGNVAPKPSDIAKLNIFQDPVQIIF